MSTKFTIYDNENIHVFGDVFDSENISITISEPEAASVTITNDSLLKINNQQVSLKISKIDFEKICKEYIVWCKKNE
jgi:hypothetical protein